MTTHSETFFQNPSLKSDAPWSWEGPEESIATHPNDIYKTVQRLEENCFLVFHQGMVGATNHGRIHNKTSVASSHPCYAMLPPSSPEQLGDATFMRDHKTRYAYQCGGMAYGIASEEMVCSMARRGFLSAFGAADLPPERIERAIQTIQEQLNDEPYSFNFIHAPSEPTWEEELVTLFLQYGIRTVEASAFINLTPSIVWYRASGLQEGSDGEIQIQNRIIAKLSRGEVARKFLSPAPTKILRQLVDEGRITPQQALMAEQIPMADDITAEADSGGHTDNQPLITLLPSLMELRDSMQAFHGYQQTVRVGAAGGLGTPQSILGAFMMGAAYVVTGSINQSSVEANTSDAVKTSLAEAAMVDVMMCPSSDMFELGARVQVLKRGAMYPLKAQRLYDVYRKYDSLDSIPSDEKEKLEKLIFRKSLDEVWRETSAYKKRSNPQHVAKAERNPKFKMSLVFHWYLGQSSAWATRQNEERVLDYQIWCGPAMGAFNDWVRGSYLEEKENRRVADIANHLMRGAAYLYRIRLLQNLGFSVPHSMSSYKPEYPVLSESESSLSAESLTV